MSLEETSLAAWRMAIKNRSIVRGGLVFHPTEVFNTPARSLPM
jgi:hypothetical protein